MTDLTFSVSKASALTGIPRKTITEILAGLPDNPTIEQVVAAFVSAARAEGASTNLLNVSQLHRITGFDRTTIKERLTAAGVAPAPGSTQKEKLFDIERSMTALMVATTDDLNQSKRTKTDAEAQMAMIKVQRARRELVPYNEARDHLQLIFHHLYQLLVVKQPRDIAEQLAGCKTSREVAALLKHNTGKVFDALRNNYKSLFRSS